MFALLAPPCLRHCRSCCVLGGGCALAAPTARWCLDLVLRAESTVAQPEATRPCTQKVGRHVRGVWMPGRRTQGISTGLRHHGCECSVGVGQGHRWRWIWGSPCPDPLAAVGGGLDDAGGPDDGSSLHLRGWGRPEIAVEVVASCGRGKGCALFLIWFMRCMRCYKISSPPTTVVSSF